MVAAQGYFHYIARYYCAIFNYRYLLYTANGKDTRIRCVYNGGKFVTTFEGDGNQFKFSYLTQFTKSVYMPVEYPSLKEFYNRIISAQREHLILKKKS